MSSGQDQPGGGHHGAEHPRVNYFGVWWYLLVLTVGEVAVVYVDLPKVTLVSILIVFALAKAILVAAYFMHLKFERKVLWVIAAAPMIFAVILTLGLVPDSEKGLQRGPGAGPTPEAGAREH